MTTQPVQPVDATTSPGDFGFGQDGPEVPDDAGPRDDRDYQDAPTTEAAIRAAAGYPDQGTATDAARAVRRLTARVEWLEEQLRASDTVPVADLDDADDALLDLADAVLAGRDAAERLLEPSARAALQAAVDRFARLEQEREQATGEVLAISAAVESSARTDPVHVHHLSRFADAERRLAAANAAVAGHAPSARASKKRLAADDETRTALAETIAAGTEAEVALNTRLRTRLAGEADRSALMPSWFSGVLGPAARGRAAAVWLDLGVQCLAHRFIYDVTDTASLLGPEPDPTAPKHQRGSHDRLGRSIEASGF